MASFSHSFTELTGIAGTRLGDDGALSALAAGAASAAGLTPHGPPVLRSGPSGTVVAVLCHGGHVVLHVEPQTGRCLLDIVAASPAAATRGADALAKRLYPEGHG
jgi:S-adenosylmethionine/arginine decarboxylase-like enzyme